MSEEMFRTGPPINTTKLKGGKRVGNLADECRQFIPLRRSTETIFSSCFDPTQMMPNGPIQASAE